jgi:RNA polymerase sigma-70 factor (ECF subfamily)
MITDKQIDEAYPTLFGIVLSMVKHEEDAKDVLQEGMERVHKYRDYYKEGNAKAWMITVVKNHAKNWLNKNNRHTSRFGGDAVPDNGYTPVIHEETMFLSDEVLDAMNTLSPIRRAIVSMYYFDGYSGHDIAKVLSIKYWQVKENLFKARKDLLNYFTSINFDASKR